MPPGRPPKRPGEPEMDNPGGAAKAKVAKTTATATAADADGHHPAQNDFSSVVKNKLQSYTRTGQACDRCKVRKIRCDALPEGCSHCLNQNLDCYVTDRVTGRTERRGYMQQLEREKTGMINHIRHLEKLLDHHGVKISPYHSAAYPADQPSNADDTCEAIYKQPLQQTRRERLTPIEAPVSTRVPGKMPMANISHNIIAETSPVDAPPGLGMARTPLSSMKGTTLSILGSTIDIRSFDAPDMDEPPLGTQTRSPLYNKSVQALLQSIMNVNPPLHVEYPPRSDAVTYAEWYFLMIHPFLPVLHKPTFMNLLQSLYDDPNFHPTTAETVMIHMVFASIYFQYGIRSAGTPEQRVHLNELSNKHYHLALGKFFDLTMSRTLYDCQALAMLCSHTMRFPKSDPAYFVASYSVNMAIELGLHRAWKKPSEGTNLENEVRKRTWWTILATSITMNGRMGRPMPIRLEEIDVDFPEMIPDELLTIHGIDTTRTGRCAYEIGITAFKISTLMLEMYANIYCSKRDPNRYLLVVEAIEEQLQMWRENLPDDLKLRDGEMPENQQQVLALYTEWMALEVHLCLRHPSVTIGNDPRLFATNTRICEDIANQMLRNAYHLHRLKSLDTTWYTLAVYIAAIFSKLVAHWERRHETTAAQVLSLREDMNKWLTVLTEIGRLMGAGMGLRDAVSSIIERTVTLIEHDRLRKAVPSLSAPVATLQSSQDTFKHSPNTPPYTTSTSPIPSTIAATTHNGALEGMNNSKRQMIADSQHSYYPENTPDSATYPSLPYNDSPSHASNSVPFHPDNPYLYTPTSGHVNAVQSHAEAQAHVQAQAQAQPPDHNPLAAFATQATQMNQPDMMWRQQASGGGNTWQDWTAAMLDNQDRYSANALMSLGGGPRNAAGANHVNNHHGGNHQSSDMGDDSMGAVGINGSAAGPTTTSQMQGWPLLLFSDGVGGS